MASSTTGTIATRILNEKKEVIEGAIRSAGCGLRCVMESLSDLIEGGVIRIGSYGIEIKSGAPVQTPDRTNELESESLRGETGRESNEEVERLSEENKRLRDGVIPELEGEVSRLTDEIKALTGEITALKGGENGEPEISERLLVELMSMAKPNNLTVEKIISDLVERLESGEIGIGSSGLTVGVVSDCPFNWKELSDAIDSVGSTFDEKIPLVAKAIFQGKI